MLGVLTFFLNLDANRSQLLTFHSPTLYCSPLNMEPIYRKTMKDHCSFFPMFFPEPIYHES